MAGYTPRGRKVSDTTKPLSAYTYLLDTRDIVTGPPDKTTLSSPQVWGASLPSSVDHM